VGKYDPLIEFLNASMPDLQEIKLTLKQIEIILRCDLPTRARHDVRWWRHKEYALMLKSGKRRGGKHVHGMKDRTSLGSFSKDFLNPDQ